MSAEGSQMDRIDSSEMWPAPGSFSESMLGRSVRNTEELRSEIDIMNVEHLDFILAHWIGGRILAGREVGDAEGHILGVSAELIRFFMGSEWTNANVWPFDAAKYPEAADGRRYLRSAAECSADDRFRWQQRTANLATLVYNIQHIPGIKDRLSLMKNCDLESAVGELEVAAAMSNPSCSFRFMERIKKIGGGYENKTLGNDYEAEVSTPSGRVVCCEIKTKSEGTRLTEKTVKDTCSWARRQMPKGRPGIIFLRIPEEWVEIPGAKQTIIRGINQVMRQSKRLVATVILYEVWEYIGSGRGGHFLFTSVPNTRSPFYGEDVSALVQNLTGRMRNDWLEISHWVPERLHPLSAAVRRYLDETVPADPDSDRSDSPDRPHE
jgi:hypothetical protein